MKSKWSDDDARNLVAHYERTRGQTVNEELALRVYTSRLIGSEPALVLHGGGNTSVKTRLLDDLGEPTEVLCVKGSGWDLATIEPEGLPAVRLEGLRKLRSLPALDDFAAVNAARTRLLDASAPNPSVETLLHAFLPHRFIDHSHADAILALVDQPAAESLCRDAFGDRLAIVPYVMPGFALAKLAAEVYERNPRVEGLLLLYHGLFTFGDSARESYERHVAAVTTAEEFAQRRTARTVPRTAPPAIPSYTELAPVLRGLLSTAEDGTVSSRRWILTRRTSPAIRAFLEREDLASVSRRGVVTPDHVIRTKNVPLLLDAEQLTDGEPAMQRNVQERLTNYRAQYRSYVARQIEERGRSVREIDPEPRIVLVPGLGVVAIGATPGAARIAADIYEHTVDVIETAERVGEYQALPEGDIFDMEYWPLEQAKLGQARPRPLQGRVVYVSGAGSGIGAATARAFAAEGACLILSDRNEEPLRALAQELGAVACVLDVTDESAIRQSVAQAIEVYGSLDGVVSNAGFAPQAAMDSCPPALLRASFEVNFFAHQTLAAAATRVMRRQGLGGFLLFNASKAAMNPGPGFGPYALPKAAVIALMRQYALEGGAAGIRANAVNADRVRTGLFSEDLVRERARSRGLDPEAYFRSNLLGREVTADDVARAFVTLALAESTTGCVFTVDGGNLAAAPR